MSCDKNVLRDIPALCQAAANSEARSEMSILDYLSKKALPNPKGSLSHAIPIQAVASANEEVEKEGSEKIHML